MLVMVVAAMAGAFQLQRYLQGIINPRRSLLHFFLFLLISIVLVFALIFITGFVIIYFKDFFFKK